MVKSLPASAGDMSLIPGLRRSGDGTGSALQYSHLGDPTERGAWRAIVHGVAKELDMTERLSTPSANVLRPHDLKVKC